MVGTAKYRGVKLIDLFEDCKVNMKEAQFVEFIGGDRCKTTGLPFSVTLSIKQCMDARSDILLAYEMNGQ
jgi:DMSO/TMAO reductase YedYZ molybdopterin-dependent catalytic subunit